MNYVFGILQGDTHYKNTNPELRFLSHSIINSLPAVDDETIDLTKIITLAQHHKVSGLFLEKCPLNSCEKLKGLKQFEQKKFQYRLVLLRSLLDLLNFFDSQNIPVIPYKGPVLSQLLYGNAAIRDFNDIDILIKESDLNCVYRLLKLYKKEVKDVISYEKEKHSIAIRIKENGMEVEIDIHWKFAETYFHIDYDIENLWKNAKQQQFMSVNCFFMREEDLLLSMCIHHGNMEGWKKLKYLVDLYTLLIRYPNMDWNYILNEGQRMDINKALLAGIKLCTALFDTAISNTVLYEMIKQNNAVEKLACNILKKYYGDIPRHQPAFSVTGILETILMREKISSKRLMITGLLTPHGKDFGIIDLPRQLYFIYPFVKLYRKLKRI